MRVIFPTDIHAPFQDNRALTLAMQIAQDFRPDLRVTGSDGIDFYGISKFDKDPARIKIGLQQEIDAWCAVEREWKNATPDAEVRFLPGNHEDRLRKYLWQHPEIANLDALRLDKLLEFEKNGISWDGSEYEHAEINLFDKLAIRHGHFVRSRSAMSAVAEIESDRYAVSILTGHTHRGGATYATTRYGMVQAHECFCLCKLDPPYIARPNWQQGVVLAEVDKDHLSIEAIPFSDIGNAKVAYWRGKEYRA